MSEPTGRYHAPGQGPMPGQPGYGEPITSPWAPAPQQSGPYGYGPPPRPSGGTVITAAVVQIAQASLFVLGALAILLLAGLLNGAGDELDRRSGSDVSGLTDSLSRLAAAGGLLLLAAAVFMIVLAALAIRGRRWAAIVSVVLQALAAVAGLVGLSRSTGNAPGVELVFVLASVAVAVLFLLPASTDYFAARTAARA